MCNVTTDIVCVIVFGGERSFLEPYINDTSVIELSKYYIWKAICNKIIKSIL